MFRIGDKILHPLHGVGIIEAIADQQVFGATHKYYMVNLSMKNMKIMVPVANADEIGVRKIIKSEVIDDVLEDLKSKKTSEMPANWNRRYKFNLEKIKTGNVHEVADVLRNLYLKDKKKGLSMGEKKMLDNAMQLLIGEIVCAKRVSVERAKTYITEALH